jgi:hypothetical protein
MHGLRGGAPAGVEEVERWAGVKASRAVRPGGGDLWMSRIQAEALPDIVARWRLRWPGNVW